MEKIALLVVDMQRLFLEDHMEKFEVARACEYINHVADQLRTNGHCVVHVQDVEDAREDNAAQLDFIPEVHVEANDLHVKKMHSNAFWQTELEQMIRDQGVGMVIVSGFSADQCVLFTYNGAIERGFNTVMLEKGIVSTPEVVTMTTRDRHMISYPVIEFMVRRGNA
ncbi:cysteine hydrolase family protein [Paenibacillus guangzhouensis]|uniref:cysteine hydrolase family protein n=1 Tax=Paenibacillus guangzhouensis TaxID=1473112 RepID=UPI001266BB10|nr:isochorismatase family cysteine hydrolase [Paenibacillus guangzhouensis]